MEKNNKIVWITGASSGIGAALAKIYAEKGVKLILSSRRLAALEQVKSECKNSKNIKILPVDLSDFDAAPAKVQNAFDFFGKIFQKLCPKPFEYFVILYPYSSVPHTRIQDSCGRYSKHVKRKLEGSTFNAFSI